MNKGIAAGIALLFIGLILFGLIAVDTYTMMFGKVRIEDKTYGTFEDKEIAEGDIDFVVDKVGEAAMKKKFFGITYSEKKAPLYLIMDNGGYVILQPGEKADDFERLWQQTADYFAGTRTEKPESVRYIGKTVEVTDEMLDVLKAHFDAKNISEDNWENAISLYVLVEFDTTLVIIQICISFGLIFIGIVMMIFFRRYVQGAEVYVGEKTPDEIKAEKAEKAAREQNTDAIIPESGDDE